MTKKIAVRGLARLASRFFFMWGGLAALKALWDLFGGEPEANVFSPQPWQFVTREQWFRYAGFELTYGLACLSLGWVLWCAARRLPVFVERDISEEGVP